MHITRGMAAYIYTRRNKKYDVHAAPRGRERVFSLWYRGAHQPGRRAAEAIYFKAQTKARKQKT